MKNGQTADQMTGCICRGEKKMKDIDKIIKIIIEYMKSATTYNLIRIEEHKKWEESDCWCPECQTSEVKVDNAKEPKFSNEFTEEWE